jgi:ribulose-phosphate 3-epimerase
MKIKIAPSILSADFGNLNKDVKSVEKDSDLIHVDVMDGHFVPNISIGALVVSKIKSKRPLDVHLMIENPEKYIEFFAKAGAAIITVHAEATKDLKGLLEKIKSYGVKAGVSIKPKTPISKIQKVLDLVDMVLVMTVEPGFGGQKFIEKMMDKVKALRAKKPKLDIEVDGGINEETAKIAVKAGANILVAGSYIFGAKNKKKAIDSLK